MAIATVAEPALAAQEQATLDNAVAYLNQAMCESGVRLAIVVSDYVISTFFGGDPAKLSSRNSHKGASYAALCKREDLEMGRTTLQRLVRIGLQVKAMPPELGSALTPGQHRALLVVPEQEHKVELAKKALAERWTAEQLEDVVAQEARQGAKRHEKAAVPEIVRKVAAVKKAVEALGTVEGFGVALGALTCQDGESVADALGRTGASIMAFQTVAANRLAVMES